MKTDEERFIAAANKTLLTSLSQREQEILRLGFTLGILDESTRTLNLQKALKLVPICHSKTQN